jgi:hypothetical protein
LLLFKTLEELVKVKILLSASLSFQLNAADVKCFWNLLIA